MGRGSLRALVAAGMLLPVVLTAAVLLHPVGRAALLSFFAPLPEPKHGGGPAALPPVGGVRGPESVELRTLREDASYEAPDAGSAEPRSRWALFALTPAGDIPSVEERFVRPPGMRRPDIVTRDDASIDRSIQHLTTNAVARERFVRAVKRSGRYAADISPILRAWKLSESVTAVAFVESAFDPAASSDNAMGLWQLPPDVAHVYGLAMLPTYDERRAIVRGTEAAARYLADLRERLGSWELAVAAYALGYKRTLDLLGTHECASFWEIAPSLPRAATVYVAEVMATAVLLANLARFGLDSVERDEPARTSDLDVRAGTPLPLIARAAGVSAVSLRELNPEYSTELVPTTTFPMFVHVPSHALARARELLPLLEEGKELPPASTVADRADAAAPEEERVISRGPGRRMFYHVREGDTLASLAQQYGTSVETIASDNALDSTGSLRTGMILAIRLADAPPTPPARFLSASEDEGLGKRAEMTSCPEIEHLEPRHPSVHTNHAPPRTSHPDRQAQPDLPPRLRRRGRPEHDGATP